MIQGTVNSRSKYGYYIGKGHICNVIGIVQYYMYVFYVISTVEKNCVSPTLYVLLFIVTGILSCFDACFVLPKMLFILFFHILQHLMTSFLSDVAESEASEC